jgi:microcystin degradation protein MlrC
VARIAVGGFQHETNTFSGSKTGLEDFLQADAWPPLISGREMFGAVAGMNLPVSGFIEEITRMGHEVVPLIWCAATPSGPVTREAFEEIWGRIAGGLGSAGDLDGIYLDLHGAMVTEHLDDGEGEILGRTRKLVGPDLPVIASLDLHSNTTPSMLENGSVLLSYRTYPHIDMAETGRRAARITGEVLPHPHTRTLSEIIQIPFLISLPWQCTLLEPMSSLIRAIEGLEGGDILSLSFTAGFPLADVPCCGPAAFGFGSAGEELQNAVKVIAELALEREGDFSGRLYRPVDAVRLALKNRRQGPVILADTQDNPGGGGTSDGIEIIKVLIQEGADAVAGLVYDPGVAQMAHSCGVGGVFTADLGAKSGVEGESPLHSEFLVEALGNGSLTGTGPFYSGCKMELGPMALLRCDRVRIAVASRKQQAADQAIFRHLGVDPGEEEILVLKSSVHFRADFQEMASEVIVVEAPGYNWADISKLDYRRLRKGVRTSPKCREA